MNTKPYDQAFKFLAEQDPESLLLLLGAIEPGEEATIELLPREISVAAVLPDQPYRIISARGERIAHVEAQTHWEPPVPARMAEYGGLHLYKYRVPIDSYVILLTKKNLPRCPSRKGVIEAGSTRIETRFHIIRLWKLSARQALASQRIALLPFIPLMSGGRTALEAGAAALRMVPDEIQRREVALHFVMLGGLRYNPLDLLDLIGRKGMIPHEQLKESSFYQFIYEEGRRQAIIEFFRQLVAKRFPSVRLGTEVEAVKNPARLEQLACELNELPDVATLQQKLEELANE